MIHACKKKSLALIPGSKFNLDVAGPPKYPWSRFLDTKSVFMVAGSKQNILLVQIPGRRIILCEPLHHRHILDVCETVLKLTNSSMTILVCEEKSLCIAVTLFGTPRHPSSLFMKEMCQLHVSCHYLSTKNAHCFECLHE